MALPFKIQTAFQPIIDLKTGLPFAYEALVRGPVGESAGWVLANVDDSNRYAFDQACRVSAISTAVNAGILATKALLSINFLPNAVYSPVACIQLTLKTARQEGLPLDRLMFEFTENEAVEHDHLKSIVDAYREFGFKTAIDDFGAGYSGLRLLAHLQTDVMKIDMDLVRDIEANSPRRLIVEGLVRLCRKMKIQLIAEGVETEAELATLRALGVRYVQGYLFARPQIGRLSDPDLWQDLVAEQRRHAQAAR